MKIKVPAKTVDCDICNRQCDRVLLERCVVCGREYCYQCEALICGCIHKPDVCNKCGHHEAVTAIVNKFATPLVAILKQRNKALAALRRRVMRDGQNTERREG